MPHRFLYRGWSEPVNGSDGGGKTLSQNRDLPEIPLAMAKCQLGHTVRRAIRGHSEKEFGDAAQVTRVCQGEVNSVMARVWARPETRREWITALAEESGQFDVTVTVTERIA